MKNKSVEVKTKQPRQYYRPFSEWKWRNYDGDKVITIQDFIDSHKGCEFYIGTDSQNHAKSAKRCCIFTTVLVAYQRGRGGAILMHTDKAEFIDSLRQRLLIETMRSVETAWFVNDKIPASDLISIHLDVNENIKWESTKYKEELVGLVVAQGFKCTVKPDSWASTHCADKKTK
jgi:predicted RNase H-related nuclease YkuK (DUF458 family)